MSQLVGEVDSDLEQSDDGLCEEVSVDLSRWDRGPSISSNTHVVSPRLGRRTMQHSVFKAVGKRLSGPTWTLARPSPNIPNS